MKVLVVLFCLLLSAVPRLLAFSHCVSKTGYTNLDSQCQVYCADGRCPDFCKCTDGNATETCAKLNFGSNNSLAINETVKPGTPIFTIQIAGQERWSYTLGRGGPVDGSVWNSLSRYLKLIRIGNQYEMIVDVTPDLEAIFQQSGVKLASLTLKLICERDGFPRKDSTVFLQILPVNEYAPEFFITPLTTRVHENTKVGTEVYRLRDHTLDLDVNTVTNEISSFVTWDYLADIKKDGRTYFEMADNKQGSIIVKAELDFEVLRPLGAVRLYLNVSASDVGGITSFTTLTVDIQDVDDLPPGFYDTSCQLTRKSCVVSYLARVPLRFQGQITQIVPGSIQARDLDELNVPVRYSLKSAQRETSEISNKLYINETTGHLFLESPFEENGEFDLVIEAREISRNGRASEIPLHVTVGDFIDAPDVGNLEFGSGPGSNDTSANSQFSEDPYKVLSIAQAVVILLLLLTSGILCARLKTRPRSAAVAQRPEAPNKPCEVSSCHFSKDEEPKLPPLGIAAASTSTDGVTEINSLEDQNIRSLFKDRNEPNIMFEKPSMLQFMPPAYNNWIRNYPYDENRQISGSPVSSIELERTISLTVSDPAASHGHLMPLTFSDCSKTGCNHCMSVAYPNHTNTMRRNILSVSNSSHTGRLVILSDPSLVKTRYNGNRVGYNPELLYENRKTCVSTRNQSRSETESTNSDKVRNVTNINDTAQVSNMIQTSIKDIDKKHDNTANESGVYKNRFLLSEIQNMRNVRESSDDCRPNDKESDDGYKNENSMSDDNTYSEEKSITVLCSQRKSITPGQSNKDAPSPMEKSAVSRSDSRFTQSSLSLAAQQSQKTPLPQVETTAAVPGAQSQDGLIQTASGFDNQKDTKVANCSDNLNEEYCPDKVSQSQSITISCSSQTLKNKTVSIEPHPRAITSAPSLCANGAMVSNKIQSNTSNETKQTETVKDLKSVIVGRPLVSSLSGNKSTLTFSNKEANSTEKNVKMFSTSKSVPDENFAACKSRPHTSDATFYVNKSFSSTVVPRATSSAPSRRKRKTKRRNGLPDVGCHRSQHTENYMPEIPADVSHSSCETQKCLACNVDSLNFDLQHRRPWTLNHLPHQHQPELLQVENGGCILPCDPANYWPHEYQQVYVGSLQRDQSYILLRQQELQQCGLGAQQRQRLPTVPEVLNLHLHHPNDRVVSTHDGNKICEDDATLRKPGKKDANKKKLGDLEK